MSSTSRSTVSRRTLAVGAAWAVPAVGFASPAPAASASSTVTVDDITSACKFPGNSCKAFRKAYMVKTEVCSTVNERVTITIDNVRISRDGGAPETWDLDPVGGNPITLPAASAGTRRCRIVTFRLSNQGDSRNSSLSGTADFTWSAAGGRSGSGRFQINAASTPPCNKRECPTDD